MGRINSDDLYQVLNEVEDWPVTTNELVTKAQDIGAPGPVMEFFESIPRDTVFDSEGELLSMAEQIDAHSTTATTGETGATDTDALPYEDEIL
ncbi:MAG TPA: DUF2795 domain-containing protein [Candidatus Nanoarchaeia archaeon]|nr:DUF2795 domain-containing protein [Candidatus Nanoarchaeia archaeon]